jgi:hypothetical protein
MVAWGYQETQPVFSVFGLLTVIGTHANWDKYRTVFIRQQSVWTEVEGFPVVWMGWFVSGIWMAINV